MNSKRFRIRLGLVSLTAVIVLVVYFVQRFDQDHPSELVSERLAYVTNRGIYLVNPDGSGQVFLEHSLGESAFTHIRCSPDGTQIAYTAGDLMWGSADLYVLSVDGTNLRFLTEVPPNASWGWSPDSKSIYVSRSSHMSSVWYALVQVETGRILCQDTYYPMTGERPACAPVELAGGGWWSGYDAVVAKDDNKWALAPTVDSSVVYGGVISPNEEWVAFSTYNHANSRRSWYVARSNGSELRILYTTAATHTFCYDVAWSTDSQNLAFSTYDDGQASIWMTSPNDGDTSLIIRFEEEGCPDFLKWSNERHIGFSIYGHWSRRYVVSLLSGQLTPVPPGEIFEVCEWSPDGNWLGCIGSQSIAVFMVTDGRRFDITTAGRPESARAGERLAWSSTGRWLAVSTRTGIYSFDTVTCKVRRVTAQEVRGFAWLPSGLGVMGEISLD
jgi:hypothetical protein